MTFYIIRCPTCNKEVHMHNYNKTQIFFKGACGHLRYLITDKIHNRTFVLHRLGYVFRQVRNDNGNYIPYIKKVKYL